MFESFVTVFFLNNQISVVVYRSSKPNRNQFRLLFCLLPNGKYYMLLYLSIDELNEPPVLKVVFNTCLVRSDISDLQCSIGSDSVRTLREGAGKVLKRVLYSVMNAVASRAVGGGASPRTILITGVGRGLGRALALELAKQGHTVVGCSRTQDKLDSLKLELAAATPASPSSTEPNSLSSNKHLLINADITSNNSIEELAHVVMEKNGIPDIVVNNAGAINKNNRIWEVTEEEFDTVISTNVKGIANVLRHFIPLMLPKKQGIIVNMSSGWGRSGAALVAPYCASKWAVEGLTRSVAKELPEGMAIVALNPGVINTDMLVSCFGNSAELYQTPESWASKAATMILNLTVADNGASLTV
ncbi:3-oxoacyl-[acyl-carrier-protein] reductase FabG [Morus notabilis]|uniref:3-oxoacyl-[acyl-carrier-protein] reductase FabG n=2 Tax=Morus notabilis TaxID=981085 RepID=W9QIQ8_9ROSA|nr:3-oxoacyl-[acyl-carrier-protein] reductase FabG [Morus notabilis]